MEAIYDKQGVTIYHGDCVRVMRGLPDNSVDSIVTDPPYGIRFMGKSWDGADIEKQTEKRRSYGTNAPGAGPQGGHNSAAANAGQYNLSLTSNQAFAEWTRVWAVEAMRILKPGGHMLVFCGPRTYHRMASGVEDAGFEIRDQIMWIYASGFPKSLDIAWKMHQNACSFSGRMVEYEHDEKAAKQDTQYSMRFVQSTYLSTPVYACAECGQVLQPFMPEQDTQEHRKAWAESKIIWSEQSSMEGRNNLEESEGELQGCEICKMSNRVLADGAEGQIHNGAQVSDGNPPWAITKADGGCTSYRPQSIEQFNPKLDAISIEQRAQTIRGQGTALKPAHEPIVVARKPVSGTVAENVLQHGTGGINIDGGRIEGPPWKWGTMTDIKGGNYNTNRPSDGHVAARDVESNPKGRFPANIIFDREAADMLDKQSGELTSGKPGIRKSDGFNENSYSKGMGIKKGQDNGEFGDSGGASRFFYVAKASQADRNEGLEGTGLVNNHPTVKPVDLMQYLCRLVTPPGGTVLDPFMGSGSTGKGAVREGFKFIGCDREAEYIKISIARIEAPAQVELL